MSGMRKTKYFTLSCMMMLCVARFLMGPAEALEPPQAPIFRTTALFGDHMVLQATQNGNDKEAASLRGITSPHEVLYI